MATSGKVDYIIEDIVGCGLFQVLHVGVIHSLLMVAITFNVIFMTYGIIDPGWTCTDILSNHTHPNQSIEDSVLHPTRAPYINATDLSELGQTTIFSEADATTTDTCASFSLCNNVEFNPETSTIVSEWGLVCDQAWVTTFIISIQMAGILIGSSLFGQLSDAVGRKTAIFSAQAMIAIFNIVCAFSVNWQMFAVLRFLIGVGCSSCICLFYVYTVEFATINRRAVLVGIPSWAIGCIAFGLISMWLKDWRHIHIVIGVYTAIGVIPALWLPESLRWLEVKQKRKKFYTAVRKIAKMNGKALPPLDSIETMEKENSHLDKQNNNMKYTLKDIFRPGYRISSIIIALEWFSASFIYYAISFGSKSLYGNFYINFIVGGFVEIPFRITPVFAINYFGRKRASCVYILVAGVGLLLATIFLLLPVVPLKTIGVTVVSMFVKASVLGYWGVFTAHTSELYPTVVRSIAQTWGSMIARVGGVMAPFVMPRDPDSAYISYAILGAVAFMCGLCVLKLPETKGKPLKETFDDDASVSVTYSINKP